MVVKAATNHSALIRYHLGAALIWLGVLIWAPFIILRIMGEKPFLFAFLPIHLLGVIGGSRLRSLARKELGLTPPKRDVWRRAGHVVIFISILVWLPYFYLKLVAHQPVDVMSFLPFHLTGMLTGIAFLVLSYWINRRN